MKVEFAELLMEVNKKQKENPPETEEYLLEAFRTFDVERSGKISINTLKEVMANHGERLREEDINEMVAVASDARTDDENIINYEGFIYLISLTIIFYLMFFYSKQVIEFGIQKKRSTFTPSLE